MKKVFFLALTLTLALLLVACGQVGGNGNEASGNESENQSLCAHAEFYEVKRVDPLALADGSVTSKCRACGYNKTEILPATGSVKVLAIGNSFSSDATTHLQGLMKAAGIKHFVIGNMTIGGCSLDMHWENAQTGEEAYGYNRYTETGKTYKKTSLDDVLTTERWDFIVLQQVSNTSGMPASYSNLQNLIDFVSNMSLNPDAKIMWHMTWAYQGNSTKSDFSKYNKDQMTMYNAIVGAVESQVLTKEKIAGVIPSGTAIQNLRTSYLGDTLTRDGYHMSEGIGRYTVGLTWLVKLTGASVVDITWVPTEFPQVANDINAIKEAVLTAIDYPFSVTPSSQPVADYEYPETSAETISPEIAAPQEPSDKRLTLALTQGADDGELFTTLGLDIGEYKMLDWEPTFQAFWNSQSKMTPTTDSTDTGLKYIGSRLLTKDELPVGSVIVVDEGYRYRPEAWVDSSTKNSADSRPKTTETTITLVDDTWWGQFNFRAFNLSRKSGNAETTDADHLRIYVPASK